MKVFITFITLKPIGFSNIEEIPVKAYWLSISFLIKKVAPSAYRLAEYQARRKYVRPQPEIKFAYPTEYNKAYYTTYHCSLYGKPASSESKNIKRMIRIVRPVYDNMKQPCKKNRRYHCKWCKIQNF